MKRLVLRVLLIMMAAGFAGNVAAQDISTIIVNLSQTYPAIIRLVTGVAYVMGIAMFFKALYHLKIYGELRTMMASQTSLKQPLTYILVGSIFIYLPTAVSIMLETTFGSGNILSYGSWYGASTTHDSMVARSIGTLVQIIGLIAFIRGWMMMVKAVQQGGQQGSPGKALTHIIGGVLAMNIYAFANVLSDTLGVSIT